jgi:hypothetical protein
MPSYDKRGVELQARLFTAGAGMSQAERQRIEAALNDYKLARDAVLTMIVVFLSDDSAEALTPEYNSKLRDTVRSASDKLDNMLSGISDATSAAVRFREQVAMDEMGFWALISSLKLAETRDSLITSTRRVHDLISVLDKRWQNLTEEDLRVEEAEQKAAEDLRDTLKRAMEAATPLYLQIPRGVFALQDLWKNVTKGITSMVVDFLVNECGLPRVALEALLKLASIANDVARVAELIGGSPTEAMRIINIIRSINIGGYVGFAVKSELGKPAKVLLEIADAAAKPLREIVDGKYNDILAQYREKMNNQGVVIVAYGTIRQQVDEFLKAVNLQAVRTSRDDVMAQLDRLDGGMTDGQKADWAEVRNGLKDMFNNRYVAAEKEFNDFFRANEGRFIGVVNTETERKLLEPDRWIVTINGVIGVGLDQKLRDWREQVNVLTAGPKDAYDQIQDVYASLPIEVQDQVRRAVNDAMSEQMALLKSAGEDQAKLLESCQLMVNAQKISSDMDRARLNQALRATVR